jgi:DNA-binding XRE family transcriptional regulator
MIISHVEPSQVYNRHNTQVQNKQVRNTQVHPIQVKMARAALGWSLGDLAKAAGIHRNTASNFENEIYAGEPENVERIRKALEKAGIEFTNGDGLGVRVKRKPR